MLFDSLSCLVHSMSLLMMMPVSWRSKSRDMISTRAILSRFLLLFRPKKAIKPRGTRQRTGIINTRRKGKEKSFGQGIYRMIQLKKNYQSISCRSPDQFLSCFSLFLSDTSVSLFAKAILEWVANIARQEMLYRHKNIQEKMKWRGGMNKKAFFIPYKK